jgi:uncharacterized membrane protein YtjA (UPF0391 family)
VVRAVQRPATAGLRQFTSGSGEAAAAEWNEPRTSRFQVRPCEASPMLKLAIVFLVISLIAGALGMTNVSAVTKRISFILFGLFLLIFIVLIVIAVMVGQAIT